MVSDDDTPVPDAAPAGALPPGLVRGDEGVFLDLSLSPMQLRTAVDQRNVFATHDMAEKLRHHA